MVLGPYTLAGRSTCHGTIKETILNISAVIKRKHYYVSNTNMLMRLGMQDSSLNSSKYKSTIKVEALLVQ